MRNNDNDIKKDIFKKILEILFLALYALVLWFFTYIIKDDMIRENIILLKFLLNNNYMNYLIISYLIILALQFIIKGIFKENWKTNIATTIIVLLITIISYYKQKILGTPFLPNDILLIGNIDQIAKFGLTIPSVIVILVVFILFFILLLQYLINKKYNSLKTKNILEETIFRILFFSLGIIILYNICIVPERYIKCNIKNDLGNNYNYMGANALFFMHLGDFYSITPDGYNKENFENIKLESVKELNSEMEKIKEPNIIMIMNESFSNPNNISNVEYSVNPIKNIEELHKKDKNCIVGNTVVPVYGGGTSLPEFEALTGLSSFFIEKQIFPYTSYIRDDMNSIVRIYKNNDYMTIGIHTNTYTFYNRKSVYKYLGFEKTIFEEDIESPEIKGRYISDDELANQIINEYEENKGKKYIFALTMQNHMPYTGNIYDKYDVEVKSDSLQTDELLELKDYVQGVYDGDQMYNKLVEYFKNVDEPTILVMFGDHLPALNSIYRKNNYSETDYFFTPYIIWANYDLEYEKVNISKNMSPSNLAINIMELANLEIPWYLQKFKELYINYPAINNQFIIKKNGEVLKSEYISYSDMINDCRILQYDLLIKKKYISIN